MGPPSLHRGYLLFSLWRCLTREFLNPPLIAAHSLDCLRLFALSPRRKPAVILGSLPLSRLAAAISPPPPPPKDWSNDTNEKIMMMIWWWCCCCWKNKGKTKDPHTTNLLTQLLTIIMLSNNFRSWESLNHNVSKETLNESWIIHTYTHTHMYIYIITIPECRMCPKQSTPSWS